MHVDSSAAGRARVGDADQQVAIIRIRQCLLRACGVGPVSCQRQDVAVPVIGDGALAERVRGHAAREPPRVREAAYPVIGQGPRVRLRAGAPVPLPLGDGAVVPRRAAEHRVMMPEGHAEHIRVQSCQLVPYVVRQGLRQSGRIVPEPVGPPRQPAYAVVGVGHGLRLPVE